MIKNTSNMFNSKLNDGQKEEAINYRLSQDAKRQRRYATIPNGTDMSARPSATLIRPGETGPNRSPMVYDDPLCDDIVNIYRFYREGRMNADMAASSIVNLIRVAFINGLDKKDDAFGIESLIYMDNILFNSMRYLIASIFTYGSSNEVIDMINRMIINTCSIIDYPLTDEGNNQIGKILTTIRQVIGPVYYF